MTFDPIANVLDRCADSAVVSPLDLCAAPPLGTQARRFGHQAEDRHPLHPAQAGDPRLGDDFARLLRDATYTMFPPHLYPPLLSEPYILRATATLPSAAGSSTARAVEWTVPSGRAFTVQECHLRANFAGIPGSAGFRVARNSREVFHGGVLSTVHPDGRTSVQPDVLPLASGEGTGWITSPWCATFLGGETIAIDLVTTRPTATSAFLLVQLRGYTYPLEHTR